METTLNALWEIMDLVNDMSPYLLLGFFIAGLMHVYIPANLYTKYLSGKNIRSVINAALIGIPLPLCSCGVIPTAMSLRREGASKGAAVSFLIATPQTGVDSIFATYSLMGLPFALIRPVAALFTAVFGGWLVNKTSSGPSQGGEIEDTEVCSCGHDHHHHEGHPSSGGEGGGRILGVLRYAFVEMLEDIGKWLVIGLIIAGLITVFVPDSFFAIFKDNTFMSMLLVLVISIPMYLCATGSIPIAVALMMKGLTPGAALVLLMAGPASNAASILVINKVLGRRTLVVYLLSITLGAILFGVGIDLMPREWFTSSLIMTADCCKESAAWWQWASSALLGLLLLNIVRMKLMHKETCSCEHHHHNHDDSSLHLHIQGMNCNHCSANAQKAILSCNGVKEATVDLQSTVATIRGENLNMDEIRQAVESLGFTVAE